METHSNHQVCVLCKHLPLASCAAFQSRIAGHCDLVFSFHPCPSVWFPLSHGQMPELPEAVRWVTVPGTHPEVRPCAVQCLHPGPDRQGNQRQVLATTKSFVHLPLGSSTFMCPRCRPPSRSAARTATGVPCPPHWPRCSPPMRGCRRPRSSLQACPQHAATAASPPMCIASSVGTCAQSVIEAFMPSV